MASDTVKEMNNLVETCLDGHHGYTQAAEHAESATLKSFCAECAQQRSSFASDLQAAVRAAGGEATDTGSVSAGFHRAWIGLRDSLSKGDKAIIKECIRGEESAVKSYQEAMSDDDVPPQAKTVVSQQHAAIEQALAKLNTMKAS